MTTHIYSPVAKNFFRVITLLLLLAGCFDEQLGNGYHAEMDSKERVKVTFNLNITGLMTPTRAEYGVDEQIETLDLFLFDENDLLTEVIHLTKNDAEESFTEDAGQYTGGEYNTPENSTTGTYTAWIDGNTSRIHFIANLKEGEFDFKEHEGASETEVIAPLVTQNRVYWGRTTFDGTSLSQNPVVLYRNYAKVRVGDVADGLVINGWTLYHRPVYGTMAPCDRSKLNGGTTNEQESLNPFDFTLGTSDVCLPLSEKCLMTEHNESNQTAGEEEINASSASVSYWLFEYREEEFASDEPVYAIFHITKDVNGTPTPLFYKIALLYDAEKDGYGNVTSRNPFAIKRNHEYTINFNGLSHEAGWKTFDQAVNHDPANNTEITIEESVPEIVSANHTLRIEETEEGSTTVRYYKDYTDPQTIYAINDILVYYDGDDCATNSSSGTQGINSLKVSWQGDAPAEYVANSLSVEQATDADGNAIAHTYRISFQMNGFSDSESLTKHYTEGVLCIAEQHEKLLKRYVKVYMGPAITFRPLLISSDIPNLTDERLTILFTIPDESYLPVDLYPIEVRFGSDRIDVEKNLYVDAMKVDFGADAAEHYTHVLRWQGTSATSTDWQWMAGAANTVTNAWGYKYIYTIDTPPTANEAQQRITLRTVVTDKKDFKVLMEGRSTVTGTNVFNTRELDFMMQNNGTAVFNTTTGATATIGEWVTATEGSSDQYKRIMLDGGLPETRYATRYVNIASGNLQGATVTIPYTLGTYENGEIVPDPDVQSDMASTITLWVHYDPTKFKPTTGTAQTDANGNTFVAITHDNTSATGSVTFNILDEAKNSMVFFTARNVAKYGTYSASTFVEGNVGYVHTGVNELQYSYRSAGALVSTLSQWEFNPAPSLEDAKYSFADDISIPAGKGQDLYVRIDRPKSQSGVELLVNTQGKLELQSAPRTVETTTTDAEGATTTTTVADYTFTQNDDGTYTVTLAAFEQEYCYLHFKTKEFNSACTMIMSSTDESTIGYNSAELTVINATNPFLAFEFAPEEELAKVSAERTYSVATSDNPSNVVPAIKGALIGVRVYLPKALYTAMNNDNDGIENEDIFRFSFTSRNFEPVNNSSALTTVLENQSEFNYYTVTKSTKNKTTYIITVKEGALHEGKTITTAEGEEKESCYIDILLQSTAIESAENVKFLGTNETTTDLSFYPYNTAIACEGTYTVSIEQSHDQSTWTMDNLDITTLTDNIVYYRVSITGNVGAAEKIIPVTFTTAEGNLLAGGSYTDVDDDNKSVTVNIAVSGTDPSVIIPMKLTGSSNGSTIPVNITVDNTAIKLENENNATLTLAKRLATEVKLSSDRGETVIYQNGSFLDVPYLNVPLTANETVKIIASVGEAANGEEFILDLTSTGLTPTSLTTTAANGLVVFETKTVAIGTAENINISAYSLKYALPDIVGQTIASWEQTESSIWWTDNQGTRSNSAIGNAVFDQLGDMYTSGQDLSVSTKSAFYNENTFATLTSCMKVGGSSTMSFYANDDDMYVTIGAYRRKDKEPINNWIPTGYKIYYDGNKNDIINSDNTGKETFSSLLTDKTTETEPNEIIELTFPLGKAGLYTIIRNSSPEFLLYYIFLTKGNPNLESTDFGTFTWTAEKNDAATITNATWSGNVTDNQISTSDFAEKLTLTLSDVTEDIKLTVDGAYKLADGEDGTVTASDPTVTLVPATAAVDGYLIDGTFTIKGEGATTYSYNAQDITVNVRPYVTATTSLNGVEISSDNKTLSVGDYVSMEVNIPEKHKGKAINFRPKVGWADKNQVTDVWPLKLYSKTEEGYTAGNNEGDYHYVKLPNGTSTSVFTYQWVAMNVDDYITLELWSDAATDVYMNEQFYNTCYQTSAMIINAYPTQLYFTESGDDTVNGIGQYRISKSSWQNISKDGEEVNAQTNGAASQDYSFLKNSSFDMRITIPNTQIGGEYLVKAEELVLYEDTKGAPYQFATSATEEVVDGVRYAVFTGLTVSKDLRIEFRSTSANYIINNSADMIIKSVNTKTWNFHDANVYPKDTRVAVASLVTKYATINAVDLYASTQTEFAGLIFQPAKDDGAKSWWIRYNGSGKKYYTGLAAVNIICMIGIVDLKTGDVVKIESSGDSPMGLVDESMVSSTVHNGASTFDNTSVSYSYTIAKDGILTFNNNGNYIYNITITRN